MELLISLLSDLKGDLLFAPVVVLVIWISKRRNRRFQGDRRDKRLTSRTSDYYSTEIDEF